MMKITKQIFAIVAATALSKPNPRMAAIIAMIKNTTVYQSIVSSPSFGWSFVQFSFHCLGENRNHPQIVPL